MKSFIPSLATTARKLHLDGLPIVGSLVKNTAKLVNQVLYSDTGLPASVDGQVNIKLSPRTFSGGYYGFDPKLTEELKLLAEPGRHFLDVGAHVGIASLIYTALVKTETRIAAFEPNPQVYPLLFANILVNGMHVEIFRMALNDQIGVTKFFFDGNDPNASLASDAPGKYWYWEDKPKPIMQECQVPMTTIDAFCQALSFQPGLIKLDVEGAELPVLKGAVQILKQYRPYIILETHVFAWESFGYTSEDLEKFIRDQGYQIYAPDGSVFDGVLGSGSEKDNNHYILKSL